ncbi:MAG: hypothetical protein A4E55_02166 [Pelotomaculum sp. PtaU1.Bin035]|nr:MAG: hypothetical protein A4E55_02166 [Pelotomaculum sp. PtaU1.Bin035]
MKDIYSQWIISICLMVLLGIAAASGCGRVAGQTEKDIGTTLQQQAIEDSKFATHGEFPVNVRPAADSLKLAPDLGRITSKEFIKLSKTEKELLVKNGFVVLSDKSTT